ncbi:DMT family transporter [Aureivirga sp. CE67]|uniref:DMT family transporter n=1 Tax=Aureivirga sp. CE67 TaxID=1788983 RepID=UPI0018CB57F4|nr:EamA family transporter [Aureivirga sp. CE67]
MQKENLTKYHTAVILANVFFGSNYLFIKMLMPEVLSPQVFLFIRSWAIVPFLLILFFSIIQRIKREDFLMFLLCGVLSTTINQDCFFKGLNLTSPVDASILATCAPIFVLFFSVFLGYEKNSRSKTLGVILGFLGAAFLIFESSAETSVHASLEGNLIFLLSAIAYGLYIVVSKPLIEKYNAPTVIFWVFFIGGFTIIPTTIEPVINTNWGEISGMNYLLILYVVIFGTLLGYVFGVFSLKKLNPSVSGAYIYLQPITAFLLIIILSFFVTDKNFIKDFTVAKIIACLIVFIGVLLVIRGQKKKHSIW